jgi:hypothetical protein
MRYLTRVLVLTVIAIVLLAAHASAGPKSSRAPRTRTTEVAYSSVAIPFLICLDCPKTYSLRGERFVSVEVVDDKSPVGYVDILWTVDGEEHFFGVCGETDVPQPIPPNAELTIFPWAVPDTPCPTGFSTSGKVKLTFSRSL